MPVSIRLLVVALLISLAGVVSALAAKPAPSGSFTLSDPPYVEGGTIAFTFGDIRNVTRSYEVTLGVSCTLPDGSQIDWGSQPPHSPYIKEFNSFGSAFEGYTVALSLPVEGTGYSCWARLVAVQWWKGTPIEGWTLDQAVFAVVP